MLQTLRVKNLAIVENIRVDFSDGLNVITGETGAGKSVFVGALGLVLGERADKSLIRSGEEQCGVEATFLLADSDAVDVLLEEIGLEPCEDGALIIRRIVAASGAGKILINDAPATVQALKRLGDILVDMHGPHDHQSLLSPAFQLDLLDSYGHLWPSRATYEDLYTAVCALEAQRAELDGDDQDTAGQIDLLSYQIDEIAAAELEGTSEEEIEQEHTTVANAQRILELGSGINQALSEDDGNAFDTMAMVQTRMNELASMLPAAEEWQDEAQSIAIQIQELSSAVASHMQNIDGDPERLQWLDDRMTLLHKLKRKYGGTIEEILSFLATAQQRLADLETRGERLAALDTELAAACKKMETQGKALRVQRKKISGTLATAITAALRDLGFAHGAFEVQLADGAPSASGMDDIEFGFAPNAGEEMRPLRAIASSGEISRVMLASKAILAAHDRIPVLVFDEIDANLGGEMGNAVGAKLAAVAETHQVLCITHLPQVAVHGASHYVVSKSVEGGRTRTHISAIEGKDRVEEIARMLGGRDMTSVTLKHAREMLKRP
ncbi:MAG: DNA repair protein RecN [Lentisphaerae bacterium]|nr:DNA repair protein RecN [Lentisphaerota bacterium]